MSAPRGVFILRRGLLGFRRRDVMAALAEQRRQIDELSAAVDSLLREKDRAWHSATSESGDGERIAAIRLDEISAKLDRLLAAGVPSAHELDEVDERPLYISELGDLGKVRARRIARGGGG